MLRALSSLANVTFSYVYNIRNYVIFLKGWCVRDFVGLEMCYFYIVQNEDLNNTQLTES